MPVSPALRAAIAANYHPQAAYVDNDVDWPALVEEAGRFRLTPLLYAAVENGLAGRPSPSLLANLRDDYLTNALRNALLFRQLTAVLTTLADAGLPVIVLKGAALAESVYGNVALRPMLDLDLLLPFERIADAVERLAPLGYRLSQPFLYEYNPRLFWHVWPLARPGNPVVYLELHWRLINNPFYDGRPPFDELWSRSRPATIAGVPARVLGREDQLLHLCAHRLHHHAARFAWGPLDVAYFMAGDGRSLNRAQLWGRAAQFQLGTAVRQALGEAAADWFAPIPSDILAEADGLPSTRRERWFIATKRLTHGNVLRMLGGLAGWRARLRYLLALLFPTRAYMAERYGTSPGAPLPLAHIGRLLQIGRRLLRYTIGAG